MKRIVLTAPSEAQARPACDLLAAHGIAFRVGGASLSALRGALPFADTAVTVEVLRDEDVEAARDLLAATEAAEGGNEPWLCLACGEESPGSFEVCWKCGRARAVVPGAAAGSPYRGPRPPQASPAAAAAEATAPRPGGWRDPLLAILGGCLPAALSGWYLRHRADLPVGWSRAQQFAVVDLIVGLELAMFLWTIRKASGARLRALWRGDGSWGGDVVTGLLLGGLVYVARRLSYLAVRNLDIIEPVARSLTSGSGTVAGVDWLWLSGGLLLSATMGSLLLYGVLFESLSASLRGRGGALLVTSAFGAFMWTAGSGLATFASSLVAQLLLGGGFLVSRRIRPLALAAAFSHSIYWILQSMNA